MNRRADPGHALELEDDVALARGGDRAALERVVRGVQKQVYGIAIRFLWHPQDAEDASQEILVRVVTSLAGFRGESAFSTWVYRVACNFLLNLKRQRMEERALSFEAFAAELEQGLDQAVGPAREEPERALLLQEVKIGCTLAMLLCLDRGHRLAYILGEILELEHHEAAEVLEIDPATYRKRVSRARSRINSLMLQRCGLVDANNRCRCSRKLSCAIDRGHVDPQHLLFAGSLEVARAFPTVLAEIRALEDLRRASALYRSHDHGSGTEGFVVWMRRLFERPDGADR